MHLAGGDTVVAVATTNGKKLEEPDDNDNGEQLEEQDSSDNGDQAEGEAE